MSSYGQGLQTLGESINEGLVRLAEAIEKAAEKQGSPITYNVIVNREWGLAMNESPNQGSFIIDEQVVAKRVAETMRNMEARRGNSGN